MADELTPKTLAREVGINRTYAWQLLRANPRRQPSLQLALKIMRKTGVKLGPIKDATPEEVAALNRMDERLGDPGEVAA